MRVRLKLESTFSAKADFFTTWRNNMFNHSTTRARSPAHVTLEWSDRSFRRLEGTLRPSEHPAIVFGGRTDARVTNPATYPFDIVGFVPAG